MAPSVVNQRGTQEMGLATPPYAAGQKPPSDWGAVRSWLVVGIERRPSRVDLARDRSAISLPTDPGPPHEEKPCAI
jgi:hypothetical protein